MTDFFPPDNTVLISIPSAEEVKNAVLSIHADKAPGPDGFSASFFHSNWDSIGPEIVKEIQQFFENGKLPAKINETFVRLIPKIQSPQTMSDYRPIALCNVYYKIISKLLTKRLQPLLPKLISENQSAFVKGRAIADNVLITHDALHYLKTSKAEQRVAMAVKTDMSKAYDRLEWDFIELVLQRFGFHPVWINLIMQCVSSVTYSFLINGSPRGRVKPSRGIRQGDPLSPYIFIMCSEVLSGLCNKAHEDGTLPGIQVARGCPRLNHLLFADDTMFFVTASEESGTALHGLLKRYERASGQYINTEKSAVTFSKKAPARLKQIIKNKLNIQKEGGVGKYLVLPEHFGRQKRDLFTSIVDQIVQKAKGWSNRFLSPAGKMVMLKSVLSPIPSHAMTCFKLPVSLCKRIQSALTRFWWDDRDGTKKIDWVAWSKMIQPKDNGGLEFREIQSFNDAYLAKLSWRLLQNPTCLLGRILLPKYCKDEGLITVTETDAISHGWRGILIGRDLLTQNMGWAVGNGTSINVWTDAWLSHNAQARPMGPAPALLMTTTVADLFVPETREWDIERIQQILPHAERAIRAIKPSRMGAPDKRIWLLTPNGEYSVKTGYAAALLNKPIELDMQIPEINWQKCVWKLQTTPKIKLFIWKAFHGALPVGEQLLVRHISTEGKCKACGMPESINHLFFDCRFLHKVWAAAPLMPNFESRGTIDLETTWTNLCKRVSLPPSGVSKSCLAPWLLWQIWLARNNTIFNDKWLSSEDIVTRAVSSAREWEVSQFKVQKKPRLDQTYAPLPEYCAIVRSDAA